MSTEGVQNTLRSLERYRNTVSESMTTSDASQYTLSELENSIKVAGERCSQTFVFPVPKKAESDVLRKYKQYF